MTGFNAIYTVKNTNFSLFLRIASESNDRPRECAFFSTDESKFAISVKSLPSSSHHFLSGGVVEGITLKRVRSAQPKFIPASEPLDGDGDIQPRFDVVFREFRFGENAAETMVFSFPLLRFDRAVNVSVTTDFNSSVEVC